MFATADFFKRTVLSIEDGKSWGSIVNFHFDSNIKTLTHFVVGKAGAEYYLAPTDKVFKKENDAVVFTSGDLFSELGDGSAFNPVSLPVYGTSGTLTDKVKEVYFDEKFRVKEVEGNERRFLIKEIISASPDALLIKDCRIPRKRSAAPIKRITSEKGTEVIMPNTISGNFNFLIGRRADKTILDRRNEIIIKKHAVITGDTLKRARANGKLLELSLHAQK